MFKYRTVDTSTLKGLKRAEWYGARGWKIINVGFTTLTFEKKVDAKKNKKRNQNV